MKYIKYFNEQQFLTDFTDQLKDSLSKEYTLELNKQVGQKQLDLFIENKSTGHTYTIEVKGRPEKENLPPEIIPWLNKIKDSIENKNNHFIVLSLSNVNENIKNIFIENNIDVFEYEKHKNDITTDFIEYINKLGTK